MTDDHSSTADERPTRATSDSDAGIAVRNAATRRNVLKTCGVGVGVLAGGVATGRAGPAGGSTAEEAGIADALEALITNGQEEQAVALLEKHGVEHHATHSVRRADDSSVGTLDYYSKPNSDVYFGAYAKYSGGYHAYLSWYLEPDGGNLIDDSYPGDAGVLGWEDSVWSPDPGSISMWSDYEQPSNRSSPDDPLCELENEPILDTPTNALGVKFNDMLYWGYTAKPISGGVSLDLTKEAATQGVIAGEFSHTWNPLGIATFNLADSLSFSVGVGAVSISLDLPFGADKWELPTDYSDKAAKL